MKVTVYEIHAKDNVSTKYLEDCKPCRIWNKKYDIWYTIEKTEIYEVDGKIVVKMEIDTEGVDKLKFLEILTSGFSNEFVILTPTAEQDIIIDLTLDPNIYFNIINPK